jgi:Na+-translocating ferredoxin:NAD+ oxidoreductase subunit D
MNTPHPIASPHAHEPVSVQRAMGLVLLALLPATLMGLYQFGWPAINLLLVTLLAALVVEAACLRVAGKPLRRALLDGSALLTGLLLALSLPPWAPWWIGVTGAILAILLAKQVFGGLGQNLFNPAMAARVALLISFPMEMTTFLPPRPLLADGSPGPLEGLGITFGDGFAIDQVSGATLLGHTRTELGRGLGLEQALAGHFDWQALALGNASGSLGEVSALLLLLGGLFLLWKRIITWHIPVAMLGTLVALAAVSHGLSPGRYPGMEVHLLSGATLLGAFFIATDPVTSPVSPRGQLIFGAGCGLLVFVIRTWAGYPEGVAFAVLLMNACTPLIDHWFRPRIYGRNRAGQPLSYPELETRP